jgi:ech hydrogenase subunit B
MRGALLACAYIVLAPVLGGLLAGIDRIINARMQSRVGPPVFQPFYDVLKLLGKNRLVVHRSQSYYTIGFLLFMIITGTIFFSGGDLLLTIFALTVAVICLVIGAYASNSPYSAIGAQRELLKMMAYEPMVIITAIGMYLVAKSFSVADIAGSTTPLIVYLPGIFIGFVFILTIKLQKSPFDIATSHHGHQELVKGLTTEFSGPDLAVIEIAHWYENILLLGFVYLFFGWNIPLAICAALITYFIEIYIDNVYARLTWRFTVVSSWIVAAVLGVGNLIVLDLFIR